MATMEHPALNINNPKGHQMPNVNGLWNKITDSLRQYADYVSPLLYPEQNMLATPQVEQLSPEETVARTNAALIANFHSMPLPVQLSVLAEADDSLLKQLGYLRIRDQVVVRPNWWDEEQAIVHEERAAQYDAAFSRRIDVKGRGGEFEVRTVKLPLAERLPARLINEINEFSRIWSIAFQAEWQENLDPEILRDLIIRELDKTDALSLLYKKGENNPLPAGLALAKSMNSAQFSEYVLNINRTALHRDITIDPSILSRYVGTADDFIAYMELVIAKEMRGGLSIFSNLNRQLFLELAQNHDPNTWVVFFTKTHSVQTDHKGVPRPMAVEKFAQSLGMFQIPCPELEAEGRKIYRIRLGDLLRASQFAHNDHLTMGAIAAIGTKNRLTNALTHREV